jgi:hypothetical protein
MSVDSAIEIGVKKDYDVRSKEYNRFDIVAGIISESDYPEFYRFDTVYWLQFTLYPDDESMKLRYPRFEDYFNRERFGKTYQIVRKSNIKLKITKLNAIDLLKELKNSINVRKEETFHFYITGKNFLKFSYDLLQQIDDSRVSHQMMRSLIFDHKFMNLISSI